MQKDKQLDVVSNADYEVFLTNGAPGYLEYAGTAQGRHVTIDVERGDMERCHRMEVRETRSGFEIHKASFERAVDWTEWREAGRERLTIEQNRQKAVESVKSAVDHLDAGHWMTPEEARSLSCDVENDASWVHSLFDEARIEGNSANQQAVLEKAKAMLYERHDYEYEMVHNGSGRSEEMPSQLSARHNQEWKEFEKQTLAEEFRQAITTAELERPLLQETTCDWCGTDIQTVDDHQTVDRAPMCNPCHDEYFPESAASRAQPLKPRGFIGKDILATTETERSGENTQMNDVLLKAGYDVQQLRIEQLEAWIEQSITRPSMSRELRLEGLELVEARSPDIRLAVERICPSRSQGLGQTLEIER
jgi:hypothetical protein